jgi:hypothetical protein|tara:strand:+ start:229601 stop:230623 length:1023 start_codon:yes stop_codon:yes gene_type:complete
MKFLQFITVLIGLAALSATSQAGEETPFKMSFPLNCELHKDCWPLYYVDVNRTENVVEDYACGKRSYDQHKGTDFAIRDSLAMAKGIDVRAVASGTVLRLRDGVNNDFKSKDGLEAVRKAGIECGNGVFVDHGNGFETQYCHLKKDSIGVKQGQKVERGQKLGEVGVSGLAEHPHLHLSVYKDHELIDPFMGKDVIKADCSKDYYDVKTYWDDTLPPRDERPSFYDAGFSTTMPAFDLIVQGQKGTVPKIGAKAFIFWVSMFDIRSGDYIVMKINDDKGREVVSRTISQDKDKIRQHYAAGRKISKGLPAGIYTGSVALTRVMDDGNTQTYRHSAVITLE